MPCSHATRPARRRWFRSSTTRGSRGCRAIAWRTRCGLWAAVAWRAFSRVASLTSLPWTSIRRRGSGAASSSTTGPASSSARPAWSRTTCLILQSVTLGGTGKESGDRHPKIRRGVMIGAGAEILGNIEVGEGSKVAAGSVVLAPVPPHTTVAGVPAKPVGKPARRGAGIRHESGSGMRCTCSCRSAAD